MGYFQRRKGPKWYVLTGRELKLVRSRESRCGGSDWNIYEAFSERLNREIEPSKLEELGLVIGPRRKIQFAVEQERGAMHKLKVAGVYAAGPLVFGAIGYFFRDQWDLIEIQDFFYVGWLGYFRKGLDAIVGAMFGTVASSIVRERYLTDFGRMSRILRKNSKRVPPKKREVGWRR